MADTLFISDLHLDAQRPRLTRLFLTFLESEAVRAQALYILGDLFEIWIGDDDDTPEYRLAMEGLAKATASGLPVYVMHGNRDFLIAEEFAAQTGCRLLPDPTVIDLYGIPTLLMHGDTLCTDDVEYQTYRAKIRDTKFQADFLSMSLSERHDYARHAREQSEMSKGIKQMDIMDVNGEAVAEAMRQHGVRRLIHGHTHRPGHHHFDLDGQPAERIVLGDWDEHAGSVLHVNESDLYLAATASTVTPSARKTANRKR